MTEPASVTPVMPSGRSAHADAPMAKMLPITIKASTAATLSIWVRSSATYTTGARVRIRPTATSIPAAIQFALPPSNRYVTSVADPVAQAGQRFAPYVSSANTSPQCRH